MVELKHGFRPVHTTMLIRGANVKVRKHYQNNACFVINPPKPRKAIKVTVCCSKLY